VIRVGVSGWTYAGWNGIFYPKAVPARRQLEYLAGQLNSVEINGTFYALQRPTSYLKWRDATPHDFLFAVKGGRFITHMKKLRDVEAPLANFFASGPLALEHKLGPLLWQLPEAVRFDPERLDAFFAQLPRTTRAAAALAAQHDARMDERAWIVTDADRPLRHVLEVRHASHSDPSFVRLLRAAGIGLVVADSAGRWPTFTDVTADVVYVRLHGDTELYASGYSDAALDMWAERIRDWHEHQGLDVFVYFDNDAKVYAPYDAIRLSDRLGIRDGAQPD